MNHAYAWSAAGSVPQSKIHHFFEKYLNKSGAQLGEFTQSCGSLGSQTPMPGYRFIRRVVRMGPRPKLTWERIYALQSRYHPNDDGTTMLHLAILKQVL